MAADNKSTKVKFSEPDSYHSDGSISSSEDLDNTITCTTCDKKFSGTIPFKQHKKGQSHKKAERRRRLENKLKQEEDSNLSDSEDLLSMVLKPVEKCTNCKKEFTSLESYYKHINSKVHKRKMKEDKLVKDFSKDGEFSKEKLNMLLKEIDQTTLDESEDIQTNLFDCKPCDKTFTGLAPYTQHMTSKTHHKKVKQLQMLEDVVKGDDVHYSDGKRTGGIVNEDGILVCNLCEMSFSGPENAQAHLKSKGHVKKLDFQEFIDKHKTNRSAEIQQRTDMLPHSDEEKVQEEELSFTEVVALEPNDSDRSKLSFDDHSKYEGYKKVIKKAKESGLKECSPDGSEIQYDEIVEPTDSEPETKRYSLSAEVDVNEPRDDDRSDDRSKYKECSELNTEFEEKNLTEQSQDKSEVKNDEIIEFTDPNTDVKSDPHSQSTKDVVNEPSNSNRSELSPSGRPKYEKYKKLIDEVKRDLLT